MSVHCPLSTAGLCGQKPRCKRTSLKKVSSREKLRQRGLQSNLCLACLAMLADSGTRHEGRQEGKQAGTQAGRQAGRQTWGQAGEQAGRKAGGWSGR